MADPNTPQPDFRAGAADYERRIRTLVPGYETLHELSAAVLRAQLPDTARLLCVGAGTGEETARLAAAGPQWRFVGVDPSADTLALARERMQRAGIAERVELIAADLRHTAEAPAFDAATLILVSHFLKDAAERPVLLGAIAGRLGSGAQLLLASLMTAATRPPCRAPGKPCRRWPGCRARRSRSAWRRGWPRRGQSATANGLHCSPRRASAHRCATFKA